LERCRGWQNADSLSKQFAASADRQFEFQKRSQLLICPHNETLSVAAIMVSIGRSIGGYKPPFPIPEKQSASHPRAQRNAFRRSDVRL
jgi:hypothetical protein